VVTATRKVAATLFALTALVYIFTASGHLQAGDMRSELAVAQSIVTRGDFTVTPGDPAVYVPYVLSDDGVRYTYFGIGDSILLLPAALVGRLAECPSLEGGCPLNVQQATDFAASFVDAVAAALAVVLLFFLALDLGASRRVATFLALLFAFCTIEWAYAHDAFDVGPAGLFILLGFFAIHRGVRRRQARWMIISGCALGFAVLTRLPTLLFLPGFGIYLALGIRREPWRSAGVRLMSWALPVAAALALLGWYNWARFGSALDAGQARAGDFYAFSTPLLTGLSGQLLSPGKSLFLFSAPLLLGIAGLPTFLRRHTALGLLALSIVGVNLVFYGKYLEWSGDYAWGPRYTVPITGLLLIPAIEVLSRWRRLPVIVRGGVIATAALGFVVQVLGVSVDYLHQMLLVRFQGVDPRTYWSLPYSAVWRHALAFGQVLGGNAPYPSDQVPMDLTLGLPQFTTFDFWWVYAWFNGTNPLLIVAIVGGASLLIVGLGYKLWLATLAGAKASRIAN
jgi:4-amino-4-deoxy-L-arabinose transferase-like glycosyltransferase